MNAQQLSPVGRFERILLSTDGSAFGAGAEAVAIGLAGLWAVPLRAMTMAFSNAELDAVAPQKARDIEAAALAVLERIKAQAAAAGIACETVVRHGDQPHREIVAEAEADNSDVIVMGRRGRRGLARMMVGDATAKVIGEARASILVCPKAAGMFSKRIILGTDGSRFSDAAAICAAALARRAGMPVTVVGVMKPAFGEARRAEAKAAVERVVAHFAAEGLAAEALLAEGLPDEVIVGAAAARGADLIVVGSHGRTGVARLLMGSTSERIIGQATCPVLVVKG
ncbi:MAG: universal stress protein [Caenispirillum sp.]|nr:universal stress protein [Caenispirillum sp.]